MAKFYGTIGYGESVETSPGVWEDRIIERPAYGDVTRNSRRLDNGESLNDDLSVGNSISIVADAYASQHFFAMRYIRWAGTLWVVREVQVDRPRLILKLGGVYHGPQAVSDEESTPGASPTP